MYAELTACANSGDPVNLVVSTGSTPPIVTITAPVDGFIGSEGELITFSGSAIDAEDGDLTANIVWSSNKDGVLGTGPTLVVTLSQGRHAVTATATDSRGVSGSAEISLRMQNNRGPK